MLSARLHWPWTVSLKVQGGPAEEDDVARVLAERTYEKPRRSGREKKRKPSRVNEQDTSVEGNKGSDAMELEGHRTDSAFKRL